MDWFIHAETTGHKFALMFVAILLFVGVMGGILFGIDKLKKVPTWAPTSGATSCMII